MTNGGNHYYGNTVNMHGGSGNTGMVFHQGAATGEDSGAASEELTRAVRELVRLLEELRPQLSPQDAQAVDASLPAITGEEETEPAQRRQALMTVMGIASLAETLGQPVATAIRAVLSLLGG
ncbi:hypothetical protein [Streptomyces roseicoloratus]|uniref:Uncharacterized protein n=1 Tax=Streptomyces roseicoloratus TaxID=2508722 RepID=A0ABY9RYM2_9ACTN|nr:hypothetical protein [Streptomyces roseicoloratus]WMX46289.1 hypothetical protein RGF97_17575 [Streptomyces roseicoloratus]